MAKEDLRHSIERMRAQMERIMGDLFEQTGPGRSPTDRAWQPAIDIYETRDEVVVIVELAGVEKEEINITLDEGLLWVSGTRREKPDTAKTCLHQMEIDFGPFERAIRLPAEVSGEKTEAKYENGLLTITLSKEPERG
ncbi:MAG: Hsp20/alpha crystallin family protein [Nitrospinota bacterium]